VKIQGSEQVAGRLVRDGDGRRLGRVIGIECAPDPYTVAWLLVALTGPGRKRLRAVPARAARSDDRGVVYVPFRRGQVLRSPVPARPGPGRADFVDDEVDAYYAPVGR